MKRFAVLLYGICSYAIFFGTFLYAVGFLANAVVPKSIDSGTAGPVGWAVLVNLALLGVFAVQHSVMARIEFKRWWTRVIPQPIERSTYVLASSLAMILLFWGWQPIGGTLYILESEIARTFMTALFAGGVCLVLYSTFLIDHFDLFGLRQTVLYFRGVDYSEKNFVTPSLYRYIRHPLYVGWFVTFWATPDMSWGHLFMAIGTTAYILVAIVFEERESGASARFRVPHLAGEHAEVRARAASRRPRDGVGGGGGLSRRDPRAESPGCHPGSPSHPMRRNPVMTQLTEARSFDTARAEAFGQRVLDDLNSSALVLMMSIGHRTGLFDVMAHLAPADQRRHRAAGGSLRALRAGMARRDGHREDRRIRSAGAFLLPSAGTCGEPHPRGASGKHGGDVPVDPAAGLGGRRDRGGLPAGRRCSLRVVRPLPTPSWRRRAIRRSWRPSRIRSCPWCPGWSRRWSPGSRCSTSAAGADARSVTSRPSFRRVDSGATTSPKRESRSRTRVPRSRASGT